MHRRRFLSAVVPLSLAPKLLLAQQAGSEAAPPPPAPVPWTLGLSPATPLPQTVEADEVAATELRFFSPLQMATLTRMADVLLPTLGSAPGAVQAGAPAFLDFLIGHSPAPRKQMYVGGLDWLEAQSQQRYHKSFATLAEMQAGALLQPWLRTWMTDHPPTEAHADFVNIAHADIRTATVNSKPWSDKVRGEAQETTPVALFWQPIEPDLFSERAACAQTAPSVTAAPRSEHSLPAYPR